MWRAAVSNIAGIKLTCHLRTNCLAIVLIIKLLEQILNLPKPSNHAGLKA